MSWISKSSISTVILTCIIALVPYYLYKLFVVVETEVSGVDNIPTTVEIQIHSDKFTSIEQSSNMQIVYFLNCQHI